MSIVMPRTITQSQIMQAAGDVHHQVADRGLPVADFLLDDATALHTAHRVLNPHVLARNASILCFLCVGQFTTARFLGRLLDHDPRDGKAVKAHILREHASGRSEVLGIVNHGLLMPFAWMGSTQKADNTNVINQQKVLDAVTVLLATVIVCLFISIYWSLDGTFRAIMIKKGVLSELGTSVSVTSVARREGSTSRRCNAVCTTGRNSWSHLFASDWTIPKS